MKYTDISSVDFTSLIPEASSSQRGLMSTTNYSKCNDYQRITMSFPYLALNSKAKFSGDMTAASQIFLRLRAALQTSFINFIFKISFDDSTISGSLAQPIYLSWNMGTTQIIGIFNVCYEMKKYQITVYFASSTSTIAKIVELDDSSPLSLSDAPVQVGLSES